MEQTWQDVRFTIGLAMACPTRRAEMTVKMVEYFMIAVGGDEFWKSAKKVFLFVVVEVCWSVVMMIDDENDLEM